MSSFLKGENMTAGYGGGDIIKNCSIDVRKGEIAVIVGPNGAGKSTAMKAISVSYTHLTQPTNREV